MEAHTEIFAALAVLDPLPSTLFHLLLAIACGRDVICTAVSISKESRSTSHAGVCGVCQPYRIDGHGRLEMSCQHSSSTTRTHDNLSAGRGGGGGGGGEGTTHPEPPTPISQDGRKDSATPSPVDDIPHVLGQALGIQILATASELLGSRDIARSTDALEPELEEQARRTERQIYRYRLARQATEHDTLGHENYVHHRRDEMGPVQCRRVAMGCLLGCFLFGFISFLCR